MSESMMCPYRIHGEKVKSSMVEGEFYYNETFMPCMREKCPCFHVDCGDAYCDRGGAYMILGRRYER